MGSQREKMQKKRNVGVSCSNRVSRIINTGLEDACDPSSRTMYLVHETPTVYIGAVRSDRHDRHFPNVY